LKIDVIVGLIRERWSHNLHLLPAVVVSFAKFCNKMMQIMSGACREVALTLLEFKRRLTSQLMTLLRQLLTAGDRLSILGELVEMIRAFNHELAYLTLSESVLLSELDLNVDSAPVVLPFGYFLRLYNVPIEVISDPIPSRSVRT
jgi:hypothetical protein